MIKGTGCHQSVRSKLCLISYPFWTTTAEKELKNQRRISDLAGIRCVTGMVSLLSILPPSPTTDKGGSSRLRSPKSCLRNKSVFLGEGKRDTDNFWVTHFDRPSLSHRSRAAGASHQLHRVRAAGITVIESSRAAQIGSHSATGQANRRPKPRGDLSA